MVLTTKRHDHKQDYTIFFILKKKSSHKSNARCWRDIRHSPKVTANSTAISRTSTKAAQDATNTIMRIVFKSEYMRSGDYHPIRTRFEAQADVVNFV